MQPSPETLPVVVIGAGPIGLAAAAHLADRGLPFVVLEAGDGPGAAVLGWGHIRTFTPWEYIVDPAAEKLLAPAGWARPSSETPPTGSELAALYLSPLASALGGAVRYGSRVVAVTRHGMDKSRTVGRSGLPFEVRVDDGRTIQTLLARAVIDASGTWGQPNPLGASGLPADGEQDARRFLVGPLPDPLGRDRARFAGKRSVVVGAGHSAANTLLNLARLAKEAPGTEIIWAIRGANPDKVYGGGEADQLEARGQLGTDLRNLVASGAVRLVTGFAISALESTGETVNVLGVGPDGPTSLDAVHNVAAATGFRPDLGILSETQLDLDPALEAPSRLAPLIDPQFHSCGTVPPHGHRDLAHPDEGLYVVGMKSYGRAPTFLIATGNEQVRSVVAALAGDMRAADEVQLALPETGVCSVSIPGVDADDGCCGPAVADDSAHRPLPEGQAPAGFPTGLPGGGSAASVHRPGRAG